MSENPLNAPRKPTTPPPAPKANQDDATSDRAFDALSESQQLSDGAQLLLATALVDALQGRNELHRFANLRRPQDAAMLSFLEKNAPPMIAQYATAKLHAMSNQRNTVDILRDTLRGFKGESKAKNIFKSMFGR